VGFKIRQKNKEHDRTKIASGKLLPASKKALLRKIREKARKRKKSEGLDDEGIRKKKIS